VKSRPSSPEAPRPKPQRRSLSHVGGEVETGGNKTEARALASALHVAPASPPDAPEQRGEGEDRAHVHGFHTYPARMHPVTAARLIDAFSPKRGVVLDPFCGSGTVAVETMIAGRSAIGSDLNPVAVRLTTTKTRARAKGELEALVDAARSAAQHATERRVSRAGATRKYPPEDVAMFEPHVLLELDGLRAGIHEKARDPLRSDLLVVLSALLVKLSRRRGDTSEDASARRIAAGYPSKLFVRKTQELATRLAALEALLPSPRPSVRIAQDDATRLATMPDASVDLIVTSPPYAGTYDYYAHHAPRFRWLSLDARDLEGGELGARRHYTGLAAKDAYNAWGRELESVLRAAERVLKRGGSLVLLLGDSAVSDEALRADTMVATASQGSRLECVARASQARPHFHGPTVKAFRDIPRSEHALLLRRR
jgi:DNA modification methylase